MGGLGSSLVKIFFFLVVICVILGLVLGGTEIFNPTKAKTDGKMAEVKIQEALYKLDQQTKLDQAQTEAGIEIIKANAEAAVQLIYAGTNILEVAGYALVAILSCACLAGIYLITAKIRSTF